MTLNASIPNIQTIAAAASGLESSSLVLTVGLDIFFNRVMPSDGFDVLASDFNHPLLILTLLGLLIATVALRHMTRAKKLAQGWA